MRILFNGQIEIDASVTKVWHIIAHDFAGIGQWASSIPASAPVTGLAVLAGAQVAGRVCATSVPGFGDIEEQFIFFDERSMRFTYRAAKGLPALIRRAENTWVVRALTSDKSVMESRAEIDIPFFPGLLLSPILKWQLGRTGIQTFEELKYYVEHGQPHPRKLKVQR